MSTSSRGTTSLSSKLAITTRTSRAGSCAPNVALPSAAEDDCRLGSGEFVAEGHDVKGIHDLKVGKLLCHLKSQLASSPGAHLRIG